MQPYICGTVPGMSTTPENPSAWRTAQRRCPVCGRKFLPTRRWQEYDRPVCRQKAKRDRKAARAEQEHTEGSEA